MESKSKKTA